MFSLAKKLQTSTWTLEIAVHTTAKVISFIWTVKWHLSHCTAELRHLQRFFPQINTVPESSRIENRMPVILQGYIKVNQPSWNQRVISSAAATSQLCCLQDPALLQGLTWSCRGYDGAWGSGKKQEQGVISLQFVHGLWLFNQRTWEFYIKTAQECILAVVKRCLSCSSEGKQKQSGPFAAWKAQKLHECTWQITLCYCGERGGGTIFFWKSQFSVEIFVPVLVFSVPLFKGWDNSALYYTLSTI